MRADHIRAWQAQYAPQLSGSLRQATTRRRLYALTFEQSFLDLMSTDRQLNSLYLLAGNCTFCTFRDRTLVLGHSVAPTCAKAVGGNPLLCAMCHYPRVAAPTVGQVSLGSGTVLGERYCSPYLNEQMSGDDGCQRYRRGAGRICCEGYLDLLSWWAHRRNHRDTLER